MIDLTFRDARPGDADEVVELMYQSSRALLDYSFRFDDADPRAFLRHEFLHGHGVFCHRRQRVGEAPGGGVVATGTFYPGREANRLTTQTVRSGLRHFGPIRLAAVLWRTVEMAPLFITPRADGLFIANLCVAASHRGKGACSALIEHELRAAWVRGLRVAELDVSFSNVRAQHLYERLGFRVIEERPYRGKKALDGFRRMARPLEDS
jgi:ribosomal protein S18 acetylase RimI-like enzyme